jgi:hypothetical protein
MMTIVERCTDAQELWKMFLPFVSAPEPQQLARWANRFPDELIERAFLKTARKFSAKRVRLPLDEADIHRYVTGLLVNLESDDRQKDKSKDGDPIVDRVSAQQKGSINEQ